MTDATYHELTVLIPEKAVADRFDVIGAYLAGRRVLDVGVVDFRRKSGDSRHRVHEPNALFHRICGINSDVVGIDLDAEGVDELNRMGYRVVCGDAHTIHLDQAFDTIVAGEIIEHLDNPGVFLRNMAAHLAPRGVLIVSTPNPFYAKQSGKIWRRRCPQVHEEHTCWFDPITLSELMRRQGLAVTQAYWVQPPEKWHKVWKQRFRGYFSHSFMLIAEAASQVGTLPPVGQDSS